jgi:hypothetical protein
LTEALWLDLVGPEEVLDAEGEALGDAHESLLQRPSTWPLPADRQCLATVAGGGTDAYRRSHASASSRALASCKQVQIVCDLI